MNAIKPTLEWAEQTLRNLWEQGFTGTATIRLSQGGVQGITVNQELNLRQGVLLAASVQQNNRT